MTCQKYLHNKDKFFHKGLMLLEEVETGRNCYHTEAKKKENYCRTTDT